MAGQSPSHRPSSAQSIDPALMAALGADASMLKQALLDQQQQQQQLAAAAAAAQVKRESLPSPAQEARLSHNQHREHAKQQHSKHSSHHTGNQHQHISSSEKK